MMQELQNEGYDFRQHDHVWKRVCPSLSPFPEIPPRPMPEPAEMMGVMPTGELPPMQNMPPSDSLAGRAAPSAEAEDHSCCLGAAAMGALPILGGFMRAEAASYRFARALAARAPEGKSRAAMEKLAREGESILRRLSATYFLIAGSFPQIEKTKSCGSLPCWTEGLRDLYYAEICGGVNYARAARGSSDPCLIRIYHDLGDLKGDRADMILQLIAKSRRAMP